jgi:2-polyprenyl-6-methoxyphenol hydroxylase-like FAD-dependent oxidoreductase
VSELEVVVVGGGPAGAVAALSALNEGARVTLHEKSNFPRHKVCGEFLSPEFGKVLDRLGAWDRLRESGVATIRRMSLWIGNRELRHRLGEPAYGLSRHRMDTVLLAEAAGRGAGEGSGSTAGEAVNPSTALRLGRRAEGFAGRGEGQSPVRIQSALRGARPG